jgi:hypothetical protein
LTVVELGALSVFGLDGALPASRAMAAIAGVLFVAVQDGHVVSEIQRESLVPLQSGVDIVQAIPKLADRDGGLYPSHGIGARRMPLQPALPEARGAYRFEGIETS